MATDDLSARQRAVAALAGYPEADYPAVTELIVRGADLSEARHALFYLYVGSREGQIAAATRLRSLGWDVHTPEPLTDHPNDWLVRPERQRVVLSPEFMTDTRAELENLASQFDGDYDGWEASL